MIEGVFSTVAAEACEEVLRQLAILGLSNEHVYPDIQDEILRVYCSPKSWGWNYLDLAYNWGLEHNLKFDMNTEQ